MERERGKNPSFHESWLWRFLLLLCFFSPCTSEIITLSFHNDSRPLIPISIFGFTNTGIIELQASHISWTNPDDNPLMGFFLTTQNEMALSNIEIQNIPSQCYLHTPFTNLLLTLNRSSEFHQQFPAPQADYFTLAFANCHPHSQISMNLRASLYNLDGKTKDYLSDGKTQLPTIYFLFFLLHIAIFVLWIYVCVKQKSDTHRIHNLMGMLVFFKALYLLSEAEGQAYIKRTGTPHGWAIAFYVFSFLRGVMLFTVIILIGAGWSILKPHLQGKEKWVLMMVIPLQVLANIAQVVIGESGIYIWDWFPLFEIIFMVDVICCIAVMSPIIWSIKCLQEAAKTDGKAAANLVKLTLFRQYYIVISIYIYFTRVVVLALSVITSYRFLWVSIVASEVATLAFYIFTGYKFRPAPHNPYFMLEDGEENLQL